MKDPIACVTPASRGRVTTSMLPAFALFCLGLWAPRAAWGAVPADQVPTFRLRARVVSCAGETNPAAPYAFSMGSSVTSQGAAWSEWLTFGPEQAAKAVGPHSYPNNYMRGFPVVVKLSVRGVKDPTRVEAELRFDERADAIPLEAELFGPSFGLLLWRDDARVPQAATMAEYNQRYWDVLATAPVPAAARPKLFPIVDRFISGDHDRRALHDGIHNLAAAGFSAIMLPPDIRSRETLLETGLRRTAWAIYNPPGYAFDHSPAVTPEAIAAWAEKLAAPFEKAGYAPEDMAAYAMSDEPGWYYPSAFTPLTNSPAAMARFHEYIGDQGLSPRDMGAKRWEDVLPIGRSHAVDLPSRRLFYWTARFFSWDSARHFAVSTRAMEAAFYTNMPILVNWNFFSGRFYVPGPVANNGAKQNPDAAMGGHDWLEFGRLRGCTMLWTEDWFGDDRAYQWSYYCTRLRCAAELGGVNFGGYVIPRTAGGREDGILQKILTVVGSGGKAIKYFVFGPEYSFPGNCYSENARVLPKMAEAHRMIGAAESVLWPGRRPRPQVAILMPRSAQAWDAKEVSVPTMIRDATNVDLNRATVDYMAETFDLYLALQHANIPADVLDEDDLTKDGLSPYRVVYVTEPNVPVSGQKALVRWVRDGGVLATVSGAGTRDRYDDQSDVLSDGIGIRETERARLLVKDLCSLPIAGTGTGTEGDFQAVGVKGAIEKLKGTIEARFSDGSPAVVRRELRRGQVVHFAWLPGLSYARSADQQRDGLPAGWSDTMRAWITYPTRLAGVTPPVTVSGSLVETPLLLSETGAAITLLNWSGEPVEELVVNATLPFVPSCVSSVKHGDLKWVADEAGIRFSLPLGAADIIVLKP